MSPLGWLHTVCAVISLVSGAVILLRRKGTASHRLLGWIYVGLMVALNGTALGIYRLSGSFGPFHFAALFSLATVAAGVLVAWRRRPVNQWLELHYWWMTWSYLGLLAASAAEVVSRSPKVNFWWAVALSSAVVLVLGGFVIARQARSTIEGQSPLSPIRNNRDPGFPRSRE